MHINKTIGFIGGKFLPLHQGHIYAIITASTMVDKLYVILSSSTKRDKYLCNKSQCKYMPAQIRLSWLGETFNNVENIEILHMEDNCGDNDYDWEAGANMVKNMIPEKITHIFSSESEYSKYFNKYYDNIKHIVIDEHRNTINISATQIRKDIYKNWNMLPKSVRAFFVKKVVVVGTESCGKSTLVRNLAKIYNTNYVQEIGREYCKRYKNQLTISMFDSIAMDHYRKIEESLNESNKILFIDSDAIITKYYSELYNMVGNSKIIDSIIDNQHFDLTIYLEPDVKWVDDGYRLDGNNVVRLENNKKLKSMYSKQGIHLCEISGNYNNRLKQAIKLIGGNISV